MPVQARRVHKFPPCWTWEINLENFQFSPPSEAADLLAPGEDSIVQSCFIPQISQLPTSWREGCGKAHQGCTQHVFAEHREGLTGGEGTNSSPITTTYPTL